MDVGESWHAESAARQSVVRQFSGDFPVFGGSDDVR